MHSISQYGPLLYTPPPIMGYYYVPFRIFLKHSNYSRVLVDLSLICEMYFYVNFHAVEKDSDAQNYSGYALEMYQS